MKKLFLSVVILLSVKLYANPGDTTWVQANIVPQMIGFTFDSAVAFPSNAASYRKVLMIFTLGEYTCPSGTQYCHQWDYLVRNYLIKNNVYYELGRFITPFATYGTPGFPSTWKQQYTFDVTDFYPLLQGTDTIQIYYDGWTNGFSANLKFAFIEGTPERNVYGVNSLWNLNQATYGNPADPINNHISIDTLVAPSGTKSSELHVIVTGHGSDSITQCCEIASPSVHNSYSVLLNKSSISSTAILRDDCGSNELYPQGGTWIFNRADWCPGDAVNTDIHVLTGVTAGSKYNLGLQFSPYYNITQSSYGYYVLDGQVFDYGACNHTVDASLNDIISPSNSTWHSRENPSGNMPVVHVRNAGSSVINSIVFSYNVKDSAAVKYTWNGTLASLHDTDITLANPLLTLSNMSLKSKTGVYTFIAKIISVNGAVDQDTTNNTLQSSFIAAPNWPTTFVVHFLTNNEGQNGYTDYNDNPSETSWNITDMNNNVVASQTNSDVKTSYVDTVTLTTTGFYKLNINSVNCDGLQWWVWTTQLPYDTLFVPGSFEVKRLNRTVINMNGYSYSGAYNNDFGCSFSQYFTISGTSTGIQTYTKPGPEIMVFPNPASNNISVIINAAGSAANGLFEIIDGMGRRILQQRASGIENLIDLSALQNGIYTIIYRDPQMQQVAKRIVVAR